MVTLTAVPPLMKKLANWDCISVVTSPLGSKFSSGASSELWPPAKKRAALWLYRLYHQDKVRVFDPQAVEFRCTCSRARCEGALLQIEKEEVMEMVQELGKIDMHCDYCGAQYQFDGIDVETLFSRAPGNDANKLH